MVVTLAEDDLDADADDATDATDTDDTNDVEPDIGRSRLRRVLIAAAAVGVIAALSVSALLGWQLWRQHRIDVAGRQAQQTAIDYAQLLTSIDSNKVDENFTQVLDGATGEFKDMYTKSSVQLRQLLIDNKATAHGTVVNSAIQSQSENQVVVLLMVDQTVNNTARPDPRVDKSRMKITMEKHDGRWLASKVDLP